MSAIGFLAGFDEPPRSANADSARLVGMLRKAVSRARRGTESLALALTVEETGLHGELWRSADTASWIVLLADHLRALVRPEDELVQVDRREFVLLLEGTQVENAPAVLRRLRDGVRRFAGAARVSGRFLSLRFAVVPVNGTLVPGEIQASLEASRVGAGADSEGVADSWFCDPKACRWDHRGHLVHASARPSPE